MRELESSAMPQESTFSCLGTEDVHMDGARLKHTQLQVARASQRLQISIKSLLCPTGQVVLQAKATA